ncbi:hypothetical protein AVEN_175136-1, partial [Araneus ventricosus]
CACRSVTYCSLDVPATADNHSHLYAAPAFLVDPIRKLTQTTCIAGGQDGKERRPLAYASRSLTAAERTTLRPRRGVLLSSGLSVEAEPYLFGRPFTVVTDHHSLLLVSQSQGSLRKTCTLGFEVAGYDINIVYKAAVNIPMLIHCQESLFFRSVIRELVNSFPCCYHRL